MSWCASGSAGDDVSLGEDFRWLTVGHASQPELDLNLSTPSSLGNEELATAIQRAQASGGMPGVGPCVDDCRATFEDLQVKGVVFIQEPQERPYGVEAIMRDNSGNWLVLVEKRAYTEADFDGVDMS